ncbi:hypothetical protein P152DRAFT_390917 [Eremomyces bilateralis CBS 781.70]|uniref:MYND-type zinc finger protein samB n=1 Tax=Eremomyces bilateralis CBS 781.70 TaxID=1392243 RepID=A0A6G1GBS1_9PEZI|nr:uncharacterized protein P152DRAFT_390917 [Eremomyces bilateralis CBS 781.70]KAF1815464.1 hypothetical protein P152DRAFT_390917 [Eremomyces bilateralis CBS 781.70]
MREVNFSIPNSNKASVGITTALYDRRALDCTSTLPLINSLNHLAYLTTSSPRIRDILTVDGGVERLVSILKDGKAGDLMEVWKWNLAFQCVVNIGVRGSESVRTRVVEADIVPVIATLLDNYIRVMDKCRERAEADLKRGAARLGSRHLSRGSDLASLSTHRSDRHRRHAPPPIEIPAPYSTEGRLDNDPVPPPFSLSSPPERTTFTGPRTGRTHQQTPSIDERTTFASRSGRPLIPQPLVTAGPTMTQPPENMNLRPVRDSDRLPSMLPSLQAELTSQPGSPTTPSAPAQLQSISSVTQEDPDRTPRRPSIRHQLSMSGVSDDIPSDDIMPVDSTGPGQTDPTVTLQNDIHMQDIENEEMLDAGATPVRLTPPASENTENETFDINHPSAIDGSLINPIANQPAAGIGFAPGQTVLNGMVNPSTQPLTTGWFPRFAQDRNLTASLLATMPRDDDVLMSLQLLAYVSKYCNLRSYFQKSHLVPRLKIAKDLSFLDDLPSDPSSSATASSSDPTTSSSSKTAQSPTTADECDPDDEYLLPDDFNIFPVVEKFTVKHHGQEMQYWAGVVMRNLCRKDDSRGGIRQCAYYQCGRWEEYARQFAKCRRCRRTKYCSKECQKSAWVYHRHWCEQAQQ